MTRLGLKSPPPTSASTSTSTSTSTRTPPRNTLNDKKFLSSYKRYSDSAARDIDERMRLLDDALSSRVEQQQQQQQNNTSSSLSPYQNTSIVNSPQPSSSSNTLKFKGKTANAELNECTSYYSITKEDYNTPPSSDSGIGNGSSTYLTRLVETCNSRNDNISVSNTNVSRDRGYNVTSASSDDDKGGIGNVELERNTWDLMTRLNKGDLMDLQSSSSSSAAERRKIVLEWLRNNRKITYYTSTSNSSTSNKKPKMWPNTTNRNKTGSCDPDMSIRPNCPPSCQSCSTGSCGLTCSLNALDRDDEAIFLSSVLSFMMAGSLMDALQLCVDNAQAWRAASLTPCSISVLTRAHAHSDFEDGDEQKDGGDEYLELTSVFEKQRRSNTLKINAGLNPTIGLWKATCSQLSKHMLSISKDKPSNNNNLGSSSSSSVQDSGIYESAIYALLCNDYQSLLESVVVGGVSWSDVLCVIYGGIEERSGDVKERRVRGEEVGEVKRKAEEWVDTNANANTEAETGMNVKVKKNKRERFVDSVQTSNLTALDAVLANTASLIQYEQDEKLIFERASTLHQGESLNLYNLAVKAVILDTPQEYVDAILSASSSSLSSLSSSLTLTPDVLRFVTHFALFYLHQNKVTPSSLNSLLTIYSSLLKANNLLTLIPLYISHFSTRELQVSMFTDLLVGVSDEKGRYELYVRGRDHFNVGFMVDVLDITVSAIIASAESNDDNTKLNAIRYLLLDDSLKGKCLVQSCKLLRLLMLSENVNGDRTRVSKTLVFPAEDGRGKVLPLGYFDDLGRERDGNGDGEDGDERSDFKWEFDSYALYLNADNEYLNWNSIHLETRHTVLSSSSSSSGGGEELTGNTWELKELRLDNAAEKATDLIFEILTCAGGYLFTDADADSENDSDRTKQITSLRNSQIKTVVHNYYTICTSTANLFLASTNKILARKYYAKFMDLANVIADNDSYGILEVFEVGGREMVLVVGWFGVCAEGIVRCEEEEEGVGPFA